MITETKTRRVDPDITILEISGRLNLGNSLLSIESALRRLVEEGVRKLVVDIAGLQLVHVDRIAPLDADVESACRHLAGESRAGESAQA
jgi:anti-anti-sigma regulatory factor